MIPALNEQENIAAAVREATRAVVGRVEDYELLLFNDGSSDSTGSIMDDIGRTDPRVRVFHHASPRNLGGVYKHGIAEARMHYLLMVPGDNENPSAALIKPLEAIGRADIVIPYPTNQKARPLLRQLGSRGYARLMNELFKLHVPYFNGTVIHRTDLLRSVECRTDSFAYQSEILVKLLNRGATWIPIPIEIDVAAGNKKSAALKWNNLVAVGSAVGGLWADLHLRRGQP